MSFLFKRIFSFDISKISSLVKVPFKIIFVPFVSFLKITLLVPFVIFAVIFSILTSRLYFDFIVLSTVNFSPKAKGF